MTDQNRPEILSPAGDMSSALAGLAAGADALYLGLKHFSARMQADNFGTGELASLLDLAHSQGRKIYVAINTFFKPGEEAAVSRMIRRTLQGPHPDAIIAQDLAIVELARQAGFDGEIHFSTLANLTHQACLHSAAKLGASRVILPRELSIDEIRLLDQARPQNLGLEIFVHGALCYCVSGRCWWSSYLGGKSGLRGRCVQPCRRLYKQGGKEGRFFSCRDFSLDALLKTTLDFSGIKSWKIEGRKKGPHYVYYVTTAYKLLRDNPQDAAARNEAESLLEMALGRPYTRGRFLPQRSVSPTAFGPAPKTEKADGKGDGKGSEKKINYQTDSGLLCGRIVMDQSTKSMAVKASMDLIPKDFLRVGSEEDSWHQTFSLGKRLPKGGTLTLQAPKHKTPKTGTPVYLIDRREPELVQILKSWQEKLAARHPKFKKDAKIPEFKPYTPRPENMRGARRLDIVVRGALPHGRRGKEGIKPGTVQGLWLSPKALSEVSRTLFGRISWWLPPVIWPDEEENWLRNIHQAQRNGARHFVCNSPWQEAMFDNRKDLSLTAGPFCNITNAFAIGALARMGYSQAIVSPELAAEDFLALPGQSPLPLGIVLSGYWPAGITRYPVAPLKQNEVFHSPRREGFWFRQYGQNNWIYPAWPLDLGEYRQQLEKAGYITFVHLQEYPPKELEKSDQAGRPGRPVRTSEFNWKIDVL